MTHPITPPPELVQQWIREKDGLDLVVARAAAWGADQELEACLTEVSFLSSKSLADKIRAARRPKPPSLKEQALKALESLQQRTTDPNIVEPIRRALEQLDD